MSTYVLHPLKIRVITSLMLQCRPYFVAVAKFYSALRVHYLFATRMETSFIPYLKMKNLLTPSNH